MPQHVPGFTTIGEAAQRVVEDLGADLISVPTSFWFVWTKTGHMPRKAHDTLAQATAEAARLARIHPGKKFIVLEAVQKIVAAPAERREHAA